MFRCAEGEDELEITQNLIDMYRLVSSRPNIKNKPAGIFATFPHKYASHTLTNEGLTCK